MAVSGAFPGSKGEMEFIRYDRSRFTSATGQIQAISAYYHCNRCKRSRWPAFESLGLGPGGLSQGAGRIAAWAGAIAGGFKRSGEIVKKLSGLDLSASTLERVTEQIGHEIKKEQKAEVESALS